MTRKSNLKAFLSINLNAQHVNGMTSLVNPHLIRNQSGFDYKINSSIAWYTHIAFKAHLTWSSEWQSIALYRRLQILWSNLGNSYFNRKTEKVLIRDYSSSLSKCLHVRSIAFGSACEHESKLKFVVWNKPCK